MRINKIFFLVCFLPQKKKSNNKHQSQSNCRHLIYKQTPLQSNAYLHQHWRAQLKRAVCKNSWEVCEKLKPTGRTRIGEVHGGLALLEGTPSMLEQGKEVRSPPLEEQGVTILMN